ncbi:hypothetical protein ACGFY6_20380 [Streptomyces sp. NPDC048387]|uniref:hypothetical protein n=1 Tax=Streptomyces sp. NPDC048387 TaxID=3365542 RepID=UPI003711A5B7
MDTEEGRLTFGALHRRAAAPHSRRRSMSTGHALTAPWTPGPMTTDPAKARK